jgi:Flp pilus assembly protein TadG
MGSRTERGRPRARGDEGAALVEFALVSVLLFLLLFGIIQFGLVLSFKQDMTRAAAEGARAGAVAVPDGNPPGETAADAALSAAQSATNEAVDEFGGSFSGVGCSRAGMDCTNVSVGPCTEDTSKECVFVELTYDYEDHPLYGRVPLVAALMPDEVRSKSEARINE